LEEGQLMSRAISLVAGMAAFAGGFGIAPQLPQPIGERPVHYLTPSVPDVGPAMAVTSVDRSRKGDREAPVGHLRDAPAIAAVEVDGLAEPTIIYRDGIGQELFRVDPGMKLTIVAKGLVLPAITIRRGNHPPRKPAAAPAAPARPVATCDPAFKPVGDPAEANVPGPTVPGRCLAGAAAMKLAAATN
jgi:hypothetical protein